MKALELVYIAGYGRSGSTLLDRMLSTLDGVVGLGEVTFLFEQLRDGLVARCSCGQRVSECEFWVAVCRDLEPAIAAAGGPVSAASLVRKVEGMHALVVPWLIGAGLRRRYERLANALYQSLAVHCYGATHMVDSSKTAWLAAARPAALLASGLPIRVIHLVRDGRAVLFSALRGRHSHAGDGLRRPPRLAALRAALGWIAANRAARSLRGRFPVGQVLVVHYERLAGDPESELARIAAFLNVPMNPDWRMAGSELAHRFAGNRNRHAGALEVQLDEEWRGRLSLGHRLLMKVSAALAGEPSAVRGGERA